MYKRIDSLIIGAGPAGLQLSYFLSKKGRDYLVLDKASKPASFFISHLRHRKLIVFDKLYTGKTSHL